MNSKSMTYFIFNRVSLVSIHAHGVDLPIKSDGIIHTAGICRIGSKSAKPTLILAD